MNEYKNDRTFNIKFSNAIDALKFLNNYYVCPNCHKPLGNYLPFTLKCPNFFCSYTEYSPFGEYPSPLELRENFSLVTN